MKVCLEIRKKPKAKQVLTLAKVLNMLNLIDEDPLIDDLLAICDELRDVSLYMYTYIYFLYLFSLFFQSIHNNTIVTQITKFIAKLNQIKKYELPSVTSKTNSDESDEDSDNGQVQFSGIQTIDEEEE